MSATRGMTLLELLVGLMVLGMTGILLSGGIDLGRRVWERAGGENRVEAERFEAGQTLRRLIAQAEPEVATDDQAPASFTGAPDRLSFLVYETARLAEGQGRRIELYRDRDVIRLGITDPLGAAAPEDLILLRGASDLSLAYFDLPDPAGDGVWTETWTGDLSAIGSIPVLVRVSVSFDDGAAPMTLLVAPERRNPLECAVLNARLCQARAG